MPRIFERHDLRRRLLAARLAEQHVVVRRRVERRVEVDEVNRLVRYLLAQHAQVVAVVELVLPVHVGTLYGSVPPAVAGGSGLRRVGRKSNTNPPATAGGTDRYPR